MDRTAETESAPAVEPAETRETRLATLVHASGALGLVLPLVHLSVPATLWALASRPRDEHGGGPPSRRVPFLVHHAREAFRFQFLGLLWAGLLLFAIESRVDGMLEVLVKSAVVPSLLTYLWLLWSAARHARNGGVRPYPWVRTSSAASDPVSI